VGAPKVGKAKPRRRFKLEGDAVGEYLRAQEGVVPQTDAERAMRVAAVVHVFMQTDPGVAAELVLSVAQKGLAATAELCTGKARSRG
jgi:hypothetical protein